MKPEPAAKSPAKAAAKKIPEAELAVLADMEQRAKEKGALQRVRQLFGQLQSEPGLQRAYAIAAVVACREHDLGNVRTYLDRLTDRAERQRVIAECKALGMDIE